MALVFTIVGARLYYLQVIHHPEMAELADRNRIRIRRVPAPRGLVFDRRHRPLVDTRPTFDDEKVPEDSDNLSATIEKRALSGVTDVADKIASAEKPAVHPYKP